MLQYITLHLKLKNTEALKTLYEHYINLETVKTTPSQATV